jgi:hypothetical protein
MAVPLLSILPMVGDILDKIFPDKTAAEAAKVRLVELAQQGELARLQADTQLATAQAEINKIEAGSQSWFVNSWRPACGWICVLAIGFKFIGGPLLFVIGQAVGHPVELPKIETEELWPLLLGLLGLGSLRTWEKVKGAA